MPETYFLGANSYKGFYSLYGNFCAGRGDMLHIIKGGPGTGKSSFMRAIAAAAEDRGLYVERLLCSGDPDSLDGIYIPALRQGWVDGTAPHVTEPGIFGVEADYVNLTQFCRLPMEQDRAERIRKLDSQYRALYRQAYKALEAAEALREAAPKLLDKGKSAAVKRRLRGIVLRAAASGNGGQGKVTHCFMSAVSCRGRLRLKDEVKKLCKRFYVLEDDFWTASDLLDFAKEEALEAGEDVLLCRSPLNPERTEGLILLSSGLGIFDGGWEFENCRHIRLDTMAAAGQTKELRQKARTARRLSQQAMELAMERLKEAKALHDLLEAEYRPLMDFEAVTDFTQREIERVFGEVDGRQ